MVTNSIQENPEILAAASNEKDLVSPEIDYGDSRVKDPGLDLSGSLHGAGGIGGLLAQVAGTNMYLSFCDGNGNIGEVYRISDSALPTQVAHFAYDPFGRLVVSTIDLSLHWPFRFSTRYTDLATGLITFPARPYSPTLGRFLSKDPIEERGGLNLFAYCGNDPSDRFDALGLLGQGRNTGQAGHVEMSGNLPYLVVDTCVCANPSTPSCTFSGIVWTQPGSFVSSINCTCDCKYSCVCPTGTYAITGFCRTRAYPNFPPGNPPPGPPPPGPIIITML